MRTEMGHLGEVLRGAPFLFGKVFVMEEQVFVVGTQRNAATRTQRRQQGIKRRQVRFGPGGVFLVRSGRRLAITPIDAKNSAEELQRYIDAGMVVLQDGNGNPLTLSEVTGAPEPKIVKETKAPKSVEETLVDTPAPEEEVADEEPQEEPESEEGDEEPAEASAKPYEDWTYNELAAEVAARGLTPESRKKDDLIVALWQSDGA